MEEWKFVNELYEISSEGRLKKGSFILKGYIKKHGYIEYSMSIQSKRIYGLAHRLVAEFFIGKENNKVVNHKDFNKLNNNVANLEWVTQKENVDHSKNYNRYPSSEEHVEYKRDKMKSVINDKGEIFESIRAAQRFYNVSHIHSSINKGGKCGGMYWNYNTNNIEDNG